MCTCECAELRIHGWMHACLSCFLFLFLKVSHQFPVFLLKKTTTQSHHVTLTSTLILRNQPNMIVCSFSEPHVVPKSFFLLWNIKSDICKHVQAVFFLYKKSIVAVQLICACPFQTSSPLTRQTKISPLFSKFEYALIFEYTFFSQQLKLV